MGDCSQKTQGTIEVTEEERTFLKLKCTVTYSYPHRRYFWRDSVGDHSSNIILFAEEKNADGEWEIVYENQVME